jgi:hypothetical protein
MAQGFMPVVAPPQNSSAFPAELVRFSTQVEYARARKLHSRRSESFRADGEYFGAQLTPLHDRDLEAMEDLFKGEEMDRIDAEVGFVLRMLWPEPCWEEDLFSSQSAKEYEFLAEYL